MTNQPRNDSGSARHRVRARRVEGYDNLKKDAERFEAFGVRFFVASLDDIIRSKEAAGRPKDLDDVAILRAMKRIK